jgi:HSP20 family protein
MLTENGVVRSSPLITIKVEVALLGLCLKQHLVPNAKESPEMTEAAIKLPVTEEKATEPEVSEEGKQAEPPVAHRDWWPLESLRREVERVFDEFYRGHWRLPFTRTAFDVAPIRPAEAIWGATPAVDIVERDQDYIITAEMPGVQATEVEVTLSNGRLTVKGEKREEKEEDRKGVHLSERRYGSFQRTFRVPEGVEAEKITASFKNGILTVTLPKTAEAQQAARKIDVKAA